MEHNKITTPPRSIETHLRTPPRRITPPRVTYSDRFIPSRTASKELFGSDPPSPKKPKTKPHLSNFDDSTSLSTSPSEAPSPAYSLVLGSELLGDNLEIRRKADNKIESNPRVLTYKTTTPKKKLDCSPYSSSPISQRTQILLKSPPKTPRKIPTLPTRVLEAPEIKDDFYLNLIDWSSQNLLAVGLGTSVYLWNAGTGQVTHLCDLGPSDTVTSVNWSARGNFLAVGTNKGLVQQWDVAKGKIVRELAGHKSRVGAMAWKDNVLSSGSRDRVILNRDVRDPSNFTKKLIGHRQEVCGLEWSPDGSSLASGGNDNKLFVWDVNNSKSLWKFNDHTAAVKAIAWSPHQRGLLASGGGTADRCIRFWNTLAGKCVNSIDTGSQVCNIAWSKNVNELVSTHGYSQNQIALWSYPELRPLATLTGHTTRVLYLAVSPDGQTIVTGAGDETLRFWNVFPSHRSNTLPATASASLGTRMDIR